MLVNDNKIQPYIPFQIQNRDTISIPTERNTYTWVYDCETKELYDKNGRDIKYILDKNGVYKSKVER